jgi:hypothetical protein
MVIEQAPDNIVRSLDTALQSSRGGPMAEVHGLVSAEITDRRVRNSVFGPIAPLCRKVAEEPSYLPPASPRLLWAALKRDQPSEVAEARRITLAMRRDDGPPPIWDELCQRCIDGLASGAAPYGEAAEKLGGGAVVQRLTTGLELSPLARTIHPRLPGWVRAMSGEAAVGLRIAFKDATEKNPDAAPVFMEMIYGLLPEEPWQILRVISAVMDRPSDRYLAASEMASFGERLLADVERRIAEVDKFDPDQGTQAAISLAASVQTATIIIAEFEQQLELSKDGPWTKRLVRARKALASGVEGRLRHSLAAVSEALPTYARQVGRSSRQAPLTSEPVDKEAVRRGYAILTFVSETRSSAGHGGFAMVRAKVIEELDKQVDLYAEDLIDELHEEGDASGRVAELIDVAAGYLGLIRDPRAADLIKRRAAAA